MPVILSSSGTEILVDSEDVERLSKHAWSDFYPRGQGPYFHASIGGETQSLHRFILGVTNGDVVDHKSGDTLDHRKKNLRRCSHQQNSFNRGTPKHNTTGVKGVSLTHYGKYRATIQDNGKSKHLGVFETALEAGEAYQKRAKELHGEFYYVAA